MASAEASESPPDESTISYHCPVASHSSPFPSKGVAASDTDVSETPSSTRLFFAGIISPLYKAAQGKTAQQRKAKAKKMAKTEKVVVRMTIKLRLRRDVWMRRR